MSACRAANNSMKTRINISFAGQKGWKMHTWLDYLPIPSETESVNQIEGK
jgi:hypothetical protein